MCTRESFWNCRGNISLFLALPFYDLLITVIGPNSHQSCRYHPYKLRGGYTNTDLCTFEYLFLLPPSSLYFKVLIDINWSGSVLSRLWRPCWVYVFVLLKAPSLLHHQSRIAASLESRSIPWSDGYIKVKLSGFCDDIAWKYLNIL